MTNIVSNSNDKDKDKGEQPGAFSHTLELPEVKALLAQYGNIPEYKDFFEKIVLKDGVLTLNNKKISLLIVPANGTDVIAGETVINEKMGMSGKVYLTQDAVRREVAAQGKKMLVEGTEEDFLSQFPGESGEDDGYSGEHLKEKILSLVTLLNLQKAGYYNTASNEWKNVGSKGNIYISNGENNAYMNEIRWNKEGGAGMMPASKDAAQLVLVYENVA